jgi:hypothetical protein
MKAFLDDLPGFIACIIAAATLWLGMVFSPEITAWLGG